MTNAPISISTDAAPTPVGPYSQAVVTGSMVFVAGQLGVDPATGSLVDGGVVPQATQALRNLEAVLVAAGASLDSVAKTTLFLDDFDDFAAVNEVYAGFFKGLRPARSAFEVVRLPLGAAFEIEAIAAVLAQ